MTYQEVLDYLFNQFPQYQKIGGQAYKPGLDNIRKICKHLGDPQDQLKIVHVAGTNGKGSTCSMLASVLKEAGYRTGLFTSPHLVDFTERIRINGIPIPEHEVIDFVKENKAFFDLSGASFFEWSTALAFSYFAQENVDIVVLETGLGGRLDATNIVSPLLSVITNIGIDHTQYLGETLVAIAKEKGGIIKESVPVVLAHGNQPEVVTALQEIATVKNAKLSIAQRDQKYQSDLAGGFQEVNRGSVLAVVKELNEMGWHISEEALTKGFRWTVKNSGLRGRWEMLQLFPKVIADIGHNYEGVQQVVEQLGKEKFEELRIVWGMVEDKEIEKIVKILPQNAKYYLAAPDIKRALPAEKLAIHFEGVHAYEKFTDLTSAYEKCISDSGSDDLILVGGSNFVVAEIISNFF